MAFARAARLGNQRNLQREHNMIHPPKKAEQLDRPADTMTLPPTFDPTYVEGVGHCKMILKQDPRKIAINQDRFYKLITVLRIAVDNDDGTLDKETTSYNDIFDAFRLDLKFYNFQERND